MNPFTIIDTGPLVAYLDRREKNHPQVKQIFKELKLPLVTCESVITETCFILGHLPSAVQQIGMWINDGVIKIEFKLQDSNQLVFGLIKKYQNLPMSFADACLVALFESTPNSQVFTLDHHFQVYRTSSRRIIKTVGLE